jgi:hypothetical protein
MEEKFTIEEFKNYLLTQDSRGDIMYNLNAEYVIKANQTILFLEKIKEIAETYHDRNVLASTYGIEKKCDCCEKMVLTTICIEHDSQDYSKDMGVCDDCYIAIVNYWKENCPKKYHQYKIKI